MELRIVLASLCMAATSASSYGVKSGASAQSGAFAGALAVPGLPDLTKGVPGAGSASYSSSASFAHSSASSYASSNSGTFSFGGSGDTGKVDGGSPLGTGAVANAAAFAGAGVAAGTPGQGSPGYSSGGAACNGNCASNEPSGASCQGGSCGFNPEPSKCSSGSCDNGSSPSTAQTYNQSSSKTDKPKDDGLLGYVALDEDDRPGKIESSNDVSHQKGYAAGTKSPQFGQPCSSASCGQPQSNEPSACSGPACGYGHLCSTPGGCAQQSSGSAVQANAAAFAGSAAGGYSGAPGNTRTPIVHSKPGYSSSGQYSGSFGGAPGILKPDDYSLPDKHLSSNSPQYSPSNVPAHYIPSSGSHLNAPSPQPIPQTPPVVPGPLYSGPSSYGPHEQKPQHNTPAGLPAFPSSESSSYIPHGLQPHHDTPADVPAFPSSRPSYNPHGQKPQHGTPAGVPTFSGSGAFAGAAAGSYTGSFGGPPGILKPNDFTFHGKPAKPHGTNYQPLLTAPSGPADVPYQGDFAGVPGVARPNGPFGIGTFPSSKPEKPSFGCNGGSSCERPSGVPHSPSGPGCIGPGCSSSGSYYGSFGGPPGILKPTGPSGYTEKPFYPGNPSIGCIGGSSCGGHGSANEAPVGVTQTQFALNCGGGACGNNEPYQGFGGAAGVIKPSGSEESGSFYSSQHSKPIKGYPGEGSSNHGGYGGAPNSGGGATSVGAFAAATASASAGMYDGQGGYGGPGGHQGGQGSGVYDGVHGEKGGYNYQKSVGCEGGCGGGNGGYGRNGAGAAAGAGSFGLSLGGAGPGPILGAAKEVAHSFHELGHSIGRNIGGLILGGAGAGGGGGLAVSGSFASSGAKSYAY